MALSRIVPIHTGHYTMPADGDRFPGERVVVTAFVIEHPRGVFLFDTGFSPDEWIARLWDLDPVRVYFAHDRAVWERSLEKEIR